MLQPPTHRQALRLWLTAASVLLAVSLGAAAVLSLAHPASAAPMDAADRTWVTDGRVSSVLRAGDRIYLGGSFTLVGPNTGFGVALSAADGRIDASFPRINDKVRAVVADGSGGWYIGGDFQRVGSAFRPGLAHILASGAVDLAWKPRTDGSVNALALSPDRTRLYAGGAFGAIDGATRNGLVALDADTGEVDPGWNPDTNGAVNALVLSPDGARLYAGGAFTSVGGVAHPRLVALEAATGAPDHNWDPNANNVVRTLALSTDGTRLYAGGTFTAVRGVARNYLAAVDSTRGFVDAWNPDANGAVNALSPSSDGDDLYAGGDFTAVGGASRNRLANIDAASGSVRPWNPDANKTVSALALSPGGDAIYVGGDFTGLGGVTRNRLAAVSAGTGAPTAWNPAANGAVNALAASHDGGRVYAGGALTSVGGVSRARLAALNASTGELDPGWAPRANKPVYALALSPDGTRIYVGGDFTTISGSARGHLAAVDVGTGAVNPRWNPAADSAVRTIFASERGVYVGGNFGTINSLPRVRLALLNDSTGAPEPGWNASANALVRTLELSADGSRLYAGGAFTEVSGQVRKNLVALDAQAGSFVGSWLPTVRRPVFDLTVSGTRVYTAEGGPAGGIAGAYRTDTAAQAWSVKGDGDVQAIALLGEKVYVGGHFVLLGDQARHQIAALDASTGAIDPLWAPTIDGDPQGGRGVWALEASGTQVHAGGDFSRVSQEPQQGFARFSG
jgi:WD40 repeat protein